MDRHEPDWWKHLKEKKAMRDAEWLAGKITDSTYTGRLLAYGYLPSEAEIELNLLRLTKEAAARAFERKRA